MGEISNRVKTCEAQITLRALNEFRIYTRQPQGRERF
jgi:hypothetical protein